MSFQQYITSVSYCVGEVADAFRVFPTVHNECVIVLEKFLMLFMSFQQYITSVSYCVVEVADAVRVFPTVYNECQLLCWRMC